MWICCKQINKIISNETNCAYEKCILTKNNNSKKSFICDKICDANINQRLVNIMIHEKRAYGRSS